MERENCTLDSEHLELSYMSQKQVMRLIAMAMADDNSVGKREFDEVCAIVIEQWQGSDVPSMKAVSRLVRDIQKSLEQPSVRQSIFMNVDALTHNDVEVEVRNLMRIIVVDNSITDREREAFIVYCRMMRVKNMSQLWRELSKMTLEELRDKSISSPEVHFRRRSSRMSLSDFEIIYETFTFYKIHSPILDGAYHILQREKTRNFTHIIRQNKRINRIAFRLFILCALVIIYPLVAVPICHQFLSDSKVVYGSVISVCILIMMLAIEWLIFMRSNASNEEETKVVQCEEVEACESVQKRKKSNSRYHTSLYLFVGIAILLDVCLGIIELPQVEVHLYGIAMKILSAVLLGCICFFTGKFFENFREQQVGDIEKMGDIAERLHILAEKSHEE